MEENREGLSAAYRLFTELGTAWFNLDGAKKFAAWYIDASEKLAKEALGFQEKATGWAKETPLAPIFEAQKTFAGQFIESSANIARTIWRIQ